MIKITDKVHKYWCARLLAVFMGLVFLLAAIFKSTDVVLFAQQIKAYNIISGYPLLIFMAWTVILLEMLIGMALVFAYRIKTTILAAAFLLLIFIGANIWASLTGATSDCGCFGSWLKRSPEVSVLENIIFMVVLFLSWVWYGRYESNKKHIGIYAVIAAGLAGIILPFLFGFSLSSVFQSHKETNYLNFAELRINDHKVVDLTKGDFLLVLMDTECGHCRDLMLGLNDLAGIREMPSIIALCINEKEQIIGYLEEFHPQFPIYRIMEKDFWPLLGESELPRIILVKDQQIIRAWNGIAPDEDEIKRLLTN